MSRWRVGQTRSTECASRLISRLQLAIRYPSSSRPDSANHHRRIELLHRPAASVLASEKRSGPEVSVAAQERLTRSRTALSGRIPRSGNMGAHAHQCGLVLGTRAVRSEWQRRAFARWCHRRKFRRGRSYTHYTALHEGGVRSCIPSRTPQSAPMPQAKRQADRVAAGGVATR
jgi:hypothetical protein